MVTMIRNGIEKDWKPEDVKEMERRGWESLGNKEDDIFGDDDEEEGGEESELPAKKKKGQKGE